MEKKPTLVRSFLGRLVLLTIGSVALPIAAACSPSSGTAPSPCESVYQGQCGKGCANDAECSKGLYCGTSGVCTSDCAPAAKACDPGSACTSTGRCVITSGAPGDPGGPMFGVGPDGAGSQDAGSCAAETHRGEGLPLDMFVIWDRSGSMDDDVNGGTKWDLVVAAFEAFLNDPQSEGIGVGIQYFPLSDDGNLPDDRNTSCNIADYSVAAVPIAPLLGNAAPIVASLAALAPSGRTPTRVGLQGAIDYARTWATQHPDRKVIVVLQTDGEPNVCNSTVRAVADVATAGVNGNPSLPTYVIGVGTELQNLDEIAQAGGTDQAFIVDTSQNTTQQFIDAMNKIRGAALLSCDFLIPAGGTIDLTKVNVSFTPNGSSQPTKLFNAATPAQCDPQAGGWYYDDPVHPGRIRLCDASCNAVKADPKGQVDLLVGCKTEPLGIR